MSEPADNPFRAAWLANRTVAASVYRKQLAEFVERMRSTDSQPR